MNKKNVLCGLAVSVLTLSPLATAAEFSPASVRALGMGGSNVASTNGVDASYWNPAAYGFFGEDDSSAESKAVDNNGLAGKDFGVSLDAGAGYYAYGPIEENRLIVESLPTSTIGASGTFNSTQITDAAKLVDGLASLNSAPQGVNVFGNATVGARVSNYGLGVRISGDFNNAIAIDNSNVGLPNLTTAFNNPLATTPQNLYFTNAQSTSLVNSLVAAGYASADAQSIVGAYDAALSLDATATGKQQDMIDALNTIATSNGDLTQNETSLSTRGVAISEIGFTYGYPINERLSVGTVLKYMRADIIAFDLNILGQNIDVGSINKDSFESSTGFGIDLGVMYRMPEWQFGLTARNVNSPSFENSGALTFSGLPYTYELKPEVKLGAAWIPTETVTVEVAYDLTENEGAVASAKSQYWNVGLEWDAFKVLALRVGAFENMSQTDIGVVTTLGFGLNMWAMRLDAGFAWSSKTITLDGSDIPAYLTGAVALAVDF